VFAVPGPITSKNSFGTNRLIQQGAKLVMNAADILEEYPHFHLNKRQEELVEGLLFGGEDADEAEVLQWIDTSGIHFDQLLEQSSLEHGTLSSILLKLELKGIVTSTPGNYYVKIR
jgi:DNA processing protein